MPQKGALRGLPSANTSPKIRSGGAVAAGGGVSRPNLEDLRNYEPKPPEPLQINLFGEIEQIRRSCESVEHVTSPSNHLDHEHHRILPQGPDS